MLFDLCRKKWRQFIFRQNLSGRFLHEHALKLWFFCFFFADNFRTFATRNAFYEEIFNLQFLLNQGRSIFKKELIYKGRCGILFGYVIWFHTRPVDVTQHDFRKQSDTVFERIDDY